MKSLKKIAYVFFIIGLGLFVGGGFWVKSTLDFANRAQAISGVISKVQEDTCETTSGSGRNKTKRSYTCYQPFVKYELAGQSYEAGMNERSSSTYDLNSSVDLLVDTKAPNRPEFKGAKLWIGPGVLCVMGLIFGSIGFFMLKSAYRKEKIKADLEANGLTVQGKVTSINLDRSLTVNGQNPWIVIAEWNHPSTKTPYTAKTLDYLWEDPASMGFISQNNEVLIKYNSSNPQQCMISLQNQYAKKVG